MEASKRMVNLFLTASTLTAAVIFYKTFELVFLTVGVRNSHLLGKQFTAAHMLGAAAGLVLLFWVTRHKTYMPTLRESGDELTKVTWPSWDETKGHTKVTIIVTLIIAFILWVFDQVFGNLTSMILG
jgi:preprotein translocase SecE subunit